MEIISQRETHQLLMRKCLFHKNHLDALFHGIFLGTGYCFLLLLIELRKPCTKQAWDCCIAGPRT
jgi:hypothetical protein